MDHEEYKMLIGADPRNPSPDMLEHRASCPECELYTQQVLSFESRLERALRVDLPSGPAEVLPFEAMAATAPASVRPRPVPWMALAASVLLAVFVAGGLWLVLPQQSLAADVVAHMAGEPQAWRRTDAAVPATRLNAVLLESKVHLSPDAGIVSYANSCSFRGRTVPHLVVQTTSGPVTVMVLVHEPVRKTAAFDEGGYRGTLIPMPGHGSIAVLMQDSTTRAEDLERIAAQVQDSIEWQR